MAFALDWFFIFELFIVLKTVLCSKKKQHKIERVKIQIYYISYFSRIYFVLTDLKSEFRAVCRVTLLLFFANFFPFSAHSTLLCSLSLCFWFHFFIFFNFCFSYFYSTSFFLSFFSLIAFPLKLRLQVKYHPINTLWRMPHATKLCAHTHTDTHTHMYSPVVCT